MATPARPVLIVDDDPAYRASVVALLGRENYGTREAATAEAAFASVREERPGCILLDVHLPDGTGTRSAARCARSTGNCFRSSS
jgi:DNA-binding response OmpR family regulator